MGELKVLPCLELAKLNETVQDHLRRISELSQAISEALKNGNFNAATAFDEQMELEIVEKELALGALKQHREDHGC